MRDWRKKLHKTGGFTLVEMLIVVAIIAILVAVSIPLVSSSLENARDNTDRANERAAKAEAVMVYLGVVEVEDWNGTASLYYDAEAGELVTSPSEITPYGKCSQDHDGGFADKANGPHDADHGIIQVTFLEDGTIFVTWVGSDGKGGVDPETGNRAPSGGSGEEGGPGDNTGGSGGGSGNTGDGEGKDETKCECDNSGSGCTCTESCECDSCLCPDCEGECSEAPEPDEVPETHDCKCGYVGCVCTDCDCTGGDCNCENCNGLPPIDFNEWYEGLSKNKQDYFNEDLSEEQRDEIKENLKKGIKPDTSGWEHVEPEPEKPEQTTLEKVLADYEGTAFWYWYNRIKSMTGEVACQNVKNALDKLTNDNETDLRNFANQYNTTHSNTNLNDTLSAPQASSFSNLSAWASSLGCDVNNLRMALMQ